MQTRKIKPEENVASKMIETIAFLGSTDYTEQLKEPSANSEGYENVWAAFTDDNIMTSRIVVIPYTVMFDGHEVFMAGIGGVASLPEYRNAGGIRNILSEAMKDMREKGQIFSYLYPFSHEYYRKFGYEICFNRLVAKFPITVLRERKPKGYLTFYNKKDDMKVYIDIYRSFVSDKNLAVVRNEKDVTNFLNKDPYTTRQYTYLWHNEDNEPKSYLTFTGIVRSLEDGMQMRISDFAWVDAEGFHGMLSCLARFDAQYTEVLWEVPDTINLYSLLAEPYEMSISVECGGMNRIIDVKKALELLKVPCGEGSTIICVTDDFLEWNNNSFEISWEKGMLKVKETSGTPDTNVSVQTLVGLVCGYFTPDTAEMSGKLEILGNRDNLNKLFIKKSLYITERF